MINVTTSCHGNENAEPGDETQTTASGLPGSHGRTGKIARLPRRRCHTAAEREAAVDKILGLTPQERHETVPEEAPPAPVEPGVTEV
jgi:hypothetical protein